MSKSMGGTDTDTNLRQYTLIEVRGMRQIVEGYTLERLDEVIRFCEARGFARFRGIPIVMLTDERNTRLSGCVCGGNPHIDCPAHP